MRKIFTIIILMCFVGISAQTTFKKSFSGWIATAYMGNTPAYNNASLIYQNRYYQSWNDIIVSFPGNTNGKYDLNGNLLFSNQKRAQYFTTMPFKMFPSGSNISMVTEFFNGSQMSICLKDTTNLNINALTTFSFPNSNWHKINDVTTLQNGDALIVGGLKLSTGVDTLGFYVRYNLATNSIITQGTVAVNTSTNTQLLSATQFPSGSVFLTGKSNEIGFIAKMTNSVNPSISSASLFKQAYGKISKLNNSKLMCFDNKTFTKIDTNLSLLSSSISYSINSIGASKSFYENNKLYSVGVMSNELSIIDTAFTSVISNTYNMPGTFFQPDLKTIGNGIFITYLDTTSYTYLGPNNYYTDISILKVKNNGASSCSSPLNYSVNVNAISTPTSVTINSSTVSLSPNTPANPTNGAPYINNLPISCTVSAPPAPTNTTPPANQAICESNSTVLFVTAPGTINWYASATSSAVLYTGASYTTPILSAGNYTYYAATINVDTSLTRTPITVTVSVCMGVQQSSNIESSFRAFPNPAKNKITVVSIINKDIIEVINVLGEVLVSAKNETGTTEINLEVLPSGIYFVRQGHLIQRIIKQ